MRKENDYFVEELLKELETELVYATTKKYLGRMAYIEDKLKKEGENWQDKNLQELDEMWDRAKKNNL